MFYPSSKLGFKSKVVRSTWVFMGMIQEKRKHTGYSKQTGGYVHSTSPRTDLRQGSVKSPQVQLEAGFSKGKMGSFFLRKLLLHHPVILMSVSFSVIQEEIPWGQRLLTVNLNSKLFAQDSLHRRLSFPLFSSKNLQIGLQWGLVACVQYQELKVSSMSGKCSIV